MKHKAPDDIGQLLGVLGHLYDHTLKKHGPSAPGVLWKDADAQVLRLEVLLSTVGAEDLNGPITVNDLGCGYGALFDLLKDDPMMRDGRYFGYDISPAMVRAARARHADPRAAFFESPVATERADYSFVSGAYNMNLGADTNMWGDYVRNNLTRLWERTGKALAFNMLDSRAKTRIDDLYYADAATFLDFAKSLSPHVEYVDDYPLDEFTIRVRR
ncbi:MAG: methyltransferase domain-containing protein [Alphaproteobacteria bacterium]|nr:methyltransferase domain-containing protein [Alphaproteobacteria bacterium]MBF0251269.1 methyltransferase domain-containing protein [Alphaproteobacteria bacterium]